MVSIPAFAQQWVTKAAKGTKLPPDVVAAQINEESGFQTGLTSPTGAEGPYQFEPSTWSSLGLPAGQENNWATATSGYITYMNQLLAQFGGNVRDALAAYNAGPANLQAGYGYADTILSNAGAAPGLQVTPQGTPTQQATLTGFSPGDLQWLEGPQGIMQAISGLFSSEGSGAVSDVDASAKAITLIASEIGDAFQALEWFFVPSHWVRVISFWVGVFLLVPGLKALMQSAQGGQGDASLAIGILLITLAGVAFFLAFHNLPDDVDNLQSLLGWITESIREGKAADSASTTAETV